MNRDLAYLGDTILDYNGKEIYYLFQDNDDKEYLPYNYFYTTDLNDESAEFDIRELDGFDNSLSIEINLKNLIDKGVIS